MEKQTVINSLAALAQETRLDVFRLLVEAGTTGMPAGQIGAELGVPSATLSFHLKELRNAGLVSSRKHGRLAIYAADYGAMSALTAYLSENCCRREGLASTGTDG